MCSTDPPRNPHERRNSETGPHAGDYESGRRKSEAKPRVQSPSLATACGVHGRIRKKDDDQWTKKVDRFLQLTQRPRHRPFLGISTRDLLCPNPRHATSKPNFTGPHTRADPRHARPSEKSTGFEVLDSIVSRRLRKSAAIRA